MHNIDNEVAMGLYTVMQEYNKVNANRLLLFYLVEQYNIFSPLLGYSGDKLGNTI